MPIDVSDVYLESHSYKMNKWARIMSGLNMTQFSNVYGYGYVCCSDLRSDTIYLHKKTMG